MLVNDAVNEGLGVRLGAGVWDGECVRVGRGVENGVELSDVIDASVGKSTTVEGVQLEIIKMLTINRIIFFFTVFPPAIIQIFTSPPLLQTS